MDKVGTFASRKALLLFTILDTEQPMLKEKRIIPSVWGGIKSFEHFQRGEYFSDCAHDLFVIWFRLLSLGWIKTRLPFWEIVNAE